MAELTELEMHRRLITSQIHTAFNQCKEDLRKEFSSQIYSLHSAIQEIQVSLNLHTERLMDLALYENKLINETQLMQKRNEQISHELIELKKSIREIVGFKFRQEKPLMEIELNGVRI